MLIQTPGLSGPQNAAFGKYLGSFDSTNSQIRADLFARGQSVYAYIKFQPGYSIETASDPWVTPIRDAVKQAGYQPGSLHLLYQGDLSCL